MENVVRISKDLFIDFYVLVNIIAIAEGLDKDEEFNKKLIELDKIVEENYPGWVFEGKNDRNLPSKNSQE